MRLSTSTCIFFNRPDGSKMDIADTIRACGQAGYEVMDMNFHDACVFKTPFVGDGWRDWVLSLGQVAVEQGIVFSQSHSHFYDYTREGAGCDELECLVRRCIEASSLLGIPWTVIHAATDFSSPFPMKSSKRKAVDYFRFLAEYAASFGVGLAIENLWELNISPQRRYTSNVEELVDLVDTIDMPNVGICWDVEHSSIMHQDIAQALGIVAGRLKCTHISDYVSVTHDHVLPYDGLSDWDGIMDSLAQVEYDGDFTYEVHRSTMRLPVDAVPSLLCYSVELGQWMVDEIGRRRRRMKENE